MNSWIFILVYESYNPLLSLFILLHILIPIGPLGMPTNWLLDPFKMTLGFLKHVLPLVLQDKTVIC